MATVPIDSAGTIEIFDKENFKINHIIARPEGGEANDAMTNIYAENINSTINLHPYYGINVVEEADAIPLDLIRRLIRVSEESSTSEGTTINPYIQQYLDNHEGDLVPDNANENYVEYNLGKAGRISKGGENDYILVKDVNIKVLRFLYYKRLAQVSYNVYGGTGANSKWLGYIESFSAADPVGSADIYPVISDNFLPVCNAYDEIVYYNNDSNTYLVNDPYYTLNISSTKNYSLKYPGFKLQTNFLDLPTLYNGRQFNHIYIQYPFNDNLKSLKIGKKGKILKKTYGNSLFILGNPISNLLTAKQDQISQNIPFSDIKIYDGNSFEEDTLIGTVRNFNNFDVVSSLGNKIRLYTASWLPVYDDYWNSVYYVTNTEEYTADSPFYALQHTNTVITSVYKGFKLRVNFRTEANVNNGDILTNIVIKIPNT